MQVFRISWHWYEEEWNYLFTHPNKTEEEFNEDIVRHIKVVGQKYLDQETSWVGASDWIEFATNSFHILGYEKVTTIDWSFFGGYILATDCHEYDNWKEVVGEDLCNKAISMNDATRKESDRSMDAFSKVNQITTSLDSYHDNWDGEGALAPLPDTIRKVTAFLYSLEPKFIEKINEYDVQPYPHGTVNIDIEDSEKNELSIEIGKTQIGLSGEIDGNNIAVDDIKGEQVIEYLEQLKF